MHRVFLSAAKEYINYKALRLSAAVLRACKHRAEKACKHRVLTGDVQVWRSVVQVQYFYKKNANATSILTAAMLSDALAMAFFF